MLDDSKITIQKSFISVCVHFNEF